nr:copia protein [Tanacetum cinerariifolium]
MKDEECESIDSTKYRGMIGLWYPKGIDIETVVYAYSDHAGDYVNRKSTSSICTFMGCCLTSWFLKKQTALAISTTEAEYGIGIEIVVYADSDHAGDYVDRKSTSSICTFMGCCLTSWYLKKQTAFAISTTEAEYVSVKKARQQALWMKQALIDYDVRIDDVSIMWDDKGATDLSKNPVQHSQTKDIEIHHHFHRDNVQKGHISIEKVPSFDTISDILTKPLKRESFNYLRLGLGMIEYIP